MATVNDLQKKLATLLDQSATAQTAGGAQWNLRMEYLNLAQKDWQDAYQWPTLYTEVNTLTSQASGNASVSLPTNFRKFDGFLTVATESSTSEYSQILPEERTQHNISDKYFYVLGNPSGGYTMVINPGSHSSGASINYSYWSHAATLASPADITMCPDDNYLVERASYYYWKASDDGRFTVAQNEAERILSRMLEFEMVRGVSYDDRVKTREESRSSFRIGRD